MNALDYEKYILIEKLGPLDCSCLQKATKQALMDREFMVQAVNKNGKSLLYAEESLKKDREIVLRAVQQNGEAIWYANEAFKKDREVVLEAVKQNGSTLLYADEVFRKDREFILESVKKNGWALSFVEESFTNDREIVLEAVKQNGRSLLYADESLKKDREIVLQAFQQNSTALEYADNSLKNDREFILRAVQKNVFALEYADEVFRKDREIVFKAVKHDGKALYYADESLKKDREIVFQAVIQEAWTLKYADDSVKKDREFILRSVQQNEKIVSNLEKEFSNDFEFVYLVSKFNKNAAHQISANLFSTIDNGPIYQKLTKDVLEMYNNNFADERHLFYCLELKNHYPQSQKTSPFNFFTNYSIQLVEKLVILEILKNISSINPSSNPSAIKDIDYHIFCFKMSKYLTENQPFFKQTVFSNLKKVVKDLSSKFEISKYSEKEVSSILHFYEEWTRDRNQFDNYRDIFTQYKKLGGNTAKIFEIFERFYAYSKSHFNKQFQIISVLGYGGEGVVFKVFSNTLNQYVAFKIKFDKVDDMNEKSTQERIKFLKRDDIEGKIQCYDCNLIDGYMYSIMKLGEETIQDFIDRNEEIYQKKPISKEALTLILTIFTKVLYSVKTLEDNNILHRDLDPKNIVKVGDQYKIIDFDIAKVAKAGNTITLTVGKYYYMSPEISLENYEEKELKDDRLLSNNGKITTSCDIFSLGCILLKLLTNCVLKLDETFLEDSNIQKYDNNHLYFNGYGIYFYLVLTDLMREKKLHHAIQKTIDQYIDPSLGVNNILTKTLITMIQKDPSKRLTCFTHMTILSKIVQFLNGSNEITIESIENEMENYKEITPLKDIPQILEENSHLRRENKKLEEGQYRMAKELEITNSRIKELEEEIKKLKSINN